MKVIIGCCGWGFFRPKLYFGKEWKSRFKSTLQAYASLFDLVEVNSTFYKLPKAKTAERWKEEAREANEDFSFTVKCSRVVTHEDRFATKQSKEAFEATVKIAKALDSNLLLLQTPASFKCESKSVKNLRSFLRWVRRRFKNLIIAWEPRGKSWVENESVVLSICKEFDLIHCVDPFRDEPLYFSKKKIAYLRLHGMGKPSMYNYKFTKNDMKKLGNFLLSLKKEKVKLAYVLFNNIYMYEDALSFKQSLKKL